MRAPDRLFLFVVPAALLASVDQVVKATVTTPWWAFHHRSGSWVALSIGLLIGALFLTRVPSRAVAVAGGVMSAGVIGNLVSARWDANYVPNPLVIGGYGHGFAFNLADVFFMLGNLLLMSALVVMTVRNRDRLAAPRPWERAVARHLRLGGSSPPAGD